MLSQSPEFLWPCDFFPPVCFNISLKTRRESSEANAKVVDFTQAA